MRSGSMTAIALLLLVGCQDKKSDTPSPGGSTAADVSSKPPTTGTPQEPVTLLGPLAGQIKGKPFIPDAVILEGNTLSFKLGKDFFPDMEIKFDLPEKDKGKLEGKEWKFGGKEFGDPRLHVSAKEPGGVPSTEPTWPNEYSMTLKITKQTAKSVEGTIDLRVNKPANTQLAGKFTATVRKTLEDPLDADDAPYVQGKIAFVGPWKQEKLAVGFVGKGTDGKHHSNMAGSTISAEFTGGGATSLTFAPQLTSLSNTKAGLMYRHTKLAPGEYVVYVRRGDGLAAWKKVTVKERDQLTEDLTIDPAKLGDVVVTLPDEETKDEFEWQVALIPAAAVSPDLNWGYGFAGAEAKKGQKTITVKGVLAGKYKVVRGKSEGEVEVVAGKSTDVTLVRVEPKKNKS
jgi:hypothetical protein